MYIFDVGSLKRELRARDISSPDSLGYLLGFAFMCLPESMPYVATRSGLALLYSAVSTAVFILGFLYCYARNGGREGRSFLQRFVSLSWVVSARFLIILSLIGLLAVLLWAIVLGNDFPRTWRAHPSVFVLSVALETLYFYRVGVHLGQVSATVHAAA
jgi:hypothetical protein